MDKKAQATMLFKMHLKPKTSFQKSVKYYREWLVTQLWYSGNVELTEEEKVAFAYPHYVIFALFENGDLVRFVSGRRHLSVEKVLTEPWRTEMLDELLDPEMLWEEIDHINITGAKTVWGAPL